jgi:hypothetical protein
LPERNVGFINGCKNAVKTVLQKWLECRFGYADQANGPVGKGVPVRFLDLNQRLLKTMTARATSLP